MRKHTRGVRAVAGLAVACIASVGLLATGATAQSGGDPGVTDDTVKLGYISSQTGAAAATHRNAHKACQGRVAVENAKGGVNGREIEVEYIDDKSGAGNLTAAQDLVQNRNVFAVIDNSAFAFLSWRFLKDQGVPMIGGGFDGNYYYNEGNENIISSLGNGTPVPGLTYDTATRMMKKLGAKKVAAVGYGASPSSSESAKAVESFAAEAQGLEGVYLNNTLEFGGTDVGPIVLGIVQGLQQNGVKMKANILATGYSQDLLDQPIAKTITPNDVMFSTYKPIELGGKSIKTFLSALKKGGLSGVPDYGSYLGYITCDMAILGLKEAGETPTRQAFVDGIRGANGGSYDGAGLMCKPIDLSLENFGKIAPTSCTYFVGVEDEKFKVLNGGKPLVGKLVGDPTLIEQYTAGTDTATTTTAPAS
jgi:ABC-type branched-subunit amino acid transport system substrate-binding protein